MHTCSSTFRVFFNEFQVLFKIVGNSRELHAFVGLFNAYGVYFSQSHKLR